MYNSNIAMIVYTDGSRDYGALLPVGASRYCSCRSRPAEVDRVVLESYLDTGAFFCHTYRDGEITQTVFRFSFELSEDSR